MLNDKAPNMQGEPPAVNDEACLSSVVPNSPGLLVSSGSCSDTESDSGNNDCVLERDEKTGTVTPLPNPTAQELSVIQQPTSLPVLTLFHALQREYSPVVVDAAHRASITTAAAAAPVLESAGWGLSYLLSAASKGVADLSKAGSKALSRYAETEQRRRTLGH